MVVAQEVLQTFLQVRFKLFLPLEHYWTLKITIDNFTRAMP